MSNRPPTDFCVGLVIGPAGGAREDYLREHFGYAPRRPHNWGHDEPVVTALARIERGSDEERAAKATRRLAACGFSSVPSWMRPYRCLSNGEAARADVAVQIARHENNTETHCVVDDFACVVNRDAAMSMACAVGKYARRERLTGLVLATAHEDCCAYLQPDWILDSATGAMTRRPGPARSPVVTWECDWSGCPMSTNWKTPPPAERRGTRNTDLVREISNTYDVTPEAIERIVLGDGALPDAVATNVTMGRVAELASQAFDFDFYGESTFVPPDFPRKSLDQDWDLGVVHGPSGSGKTTVLRQLFGGAAGKVATAAADWNNTHVVSAALKKRFGAGDASARLEACALSDEERAMRFSELSACARARAQVAWLLADDAVLDEFTSLAPRPLAWEVARGVSEYVRNNGLKRVVVASVHEDVVAHLRPSWLFPTAVATSCWHDDGKKPKPTGEVRYGCLVMLNSDHIAAAAPPRRNPNLYEPPRVTLQMRRAPYYHYAPFEKHHYLCGGVQDGAWCFEVTWHGRPVGFHAVQSAFGEVGAGEGTTGASREHRVVILPDFQGIGLGWQMSEVVAARHAEMGRRFMSITMHHTFGGGRDRSERWRPKPRNHAADKHEASHDLKHRELQAAGTWAPTPRDRLRPSYRHEYVAEGAAREAFLRATSTIIPKHKCKGEGCSHCYSNRDMVCRRIKCLDSKGKKLPKKDLEGTLWGTPPARPLGVAPPPTVDVSKRREPPALTKRLEKVEVVGGRGPKRQAAQPKGSTKAKKVAEKARARDTGGRDWTFDRRKKAWIVCAADADFALDHEAVGDEVRCDVNGEALDGEVLGVAEGPPWRCRIRYENGLQENLDEKQFGMARRAHTTWQNKLAKGAKPPHAAPKRKAPAKPAARRRKPRYEDDDDDDEAFTASAPARTGERRSARATAASGSMREASDDEDFELVDVDEPAPAPPPPPPPPKRARTAPQQEFRKGQRVDAKFGYRWYRGTVDDLVKDGTGRLRAYEIRWPSNDDCNRIARGNVRAPVDGTEEG